MKKSLPGNAKIAKDAKDTVQECVSEFISFITSEWVTWILVGGAYSSMLADDHAGPSSQSKRQVPEGEEEDHQRR